MQLAQVLYSLIIKINAELMRVPNTLPPKLKQDLMIPQGKDVPAATREEQVNSCILQSAYLFTVRTGPLLVSGNGYPTPHQTTHSHYGGCGSIQSSPIATVSRLHQNCCYLWVSALRWSSTSGRFANGNVSIQKTTSTRRVEPALSFALLTDPNPRRRYLSTIDLSTEAGDSPGFQAIAG